MQGRTRFRRAQCRRPLPPNAVNAVHTARPDDLEGQLGYTVSKGASKPFAAMKRLEELHAAGALPAAYV